MVCSKHRLPGRERLTAVGLLRHGERFPGGSRMGGMGIETGVVLWISIVDLGEYSERQNAVGDVCGGT
jgi:hypothetical protein